jgi:septal ring factor EnvC (AmiA/AmiB activator)
LPTMSSNSDRVSADDIFSQIEAKLALLRVVATAPPDAPESWLKRAFAPAAPSSRQGDINLAVVDALAAAVAALRETVGSQAIRLEQLERDVTEMRSLSANVREAQERATSAETQLAQLRQEQGELREHSAMAGTQLTQLAEKIDQLSTGQVGLGSELRERIQHMLDEQRVSIRQIALKTSEEAVLADRARRATDGRLEELASRVPKPPA